MRSLRVKFSALIVILLVLACLPLANSAIDHEKKALRAEVTKRAFVQVAALADAAKDALLAVDRGDFEEDLTLDNLMDVQERGVVAVRLLGREKRIVASRDPNERDKPGTPLTADSREPQMLLTGPHLLVAAPILYSGTPIGEAQMKFDLSTLVDPVVAENELVLKGYASLAIVLGVGGGIAFVALLVGPLRRLRVGVEQLAAGNLRVRVAPTSRDEVGELTRAFNEMGDALEQKQRIQSAFGRYVNEYVLEQLKRGPQSEQLEGMEREVTVLFADIRGFTRLSEGMKARSVVALLNEVFQIVSDRILERSGTIDKFIGDSVMAYFGAPILDENHSQNAVSAAVDIMRAIDLRNSQHAQLGSSEAAKVEIGIGIHTGTVVVGEVGSDRRTDFTVIGDVVNVAHRLEKLARPGEILVSEAVQRCVRAEAKLSFQGERQLSGREEPVHTYAVAVGPGAAPAARNPDSR